MCSSDLANINVTSTASVFKSVAKIENLPEIGSSTRIDEFLFASKESIGVIKEYCKALAKEETPNAHFASVDGCELNSDFLQFV